MELLAQLQSAIAFVASKEFIAPIAAEGYGHRSAGQFAKVPGRHGARIAERLIVVIDQCIEDSHRVGLNFKPLVLGTKMLGHRGGILGFVEVGFGKTDCKGPQRGRKEFLCDRAYQRGIDPSREECPQGYVAAQSAFDGRRQPGSKLGLGLIQADVGLIGPIDIPIALDVDSAILEDQKMTWR